MSDNLFDIWAIGFPVFWVGLAVRNRYLGWRERINAYEAWAYSMVWPLTLICSLFNLLFLLISGRER